MKILKEFKLKKILKLLRKGTVKKNIFFILFGMYFSTLAIASTLTVEFVGALIPGGNNNTPLGNVPEQQCRGNNTPGFSLLNTDRTTSPTDIEFNEDGSFVYTSNFQTAGMANNPISQNKLLQNYQILSDAIRAGTFNCDHLKGADPKSQSGNAYATSRKMQDIEIHQNGRLFFFLDDSQNLGKFTASTPYDLNTLTFNEFINLNDKDNSIEFNKDGTQIFALNNDFGDVHVATYQLPGPYDISSITEIESIDLANYGIEDIDGEDEIGQDIEFNSDGSVMFVLVGNTDIEQEYIYHFDLAENYDVSTAVKAGRFHVGAIFMNRDAGDRFGDPSGFGFSRDGMNLYLLDNVAGNGVHQINQYKLDCPYGLVKCSSDPRASVDSQVELAKQNISLNVTTIFKRFEWIKRNRDNEDLTSHNINIDYPNPLLKSLASKFEPSIKNNLASLVSNTQKKEEKKKSKWSSWSLVDLSIADYKEMDLDRAKAIKTKGITIGSDRKIEDNKFFGLALRYGDGSSNIGNTVQKVDLESLTLNIYGIVPTDNNKYINAVLGLSALRYANKYLGNISGERNGRQAFASINYRTKNTYGKLNITPTGKLTYGVTELSEFTDFISKASSRPATDIRFHEDTFESGEFAGGLLFEMEKIERKGNTFQPMGGIEIIYDLADDNTYKYSNVGSTVVNKRKINSYSNKKLKTNIGLEHILENGFTILFDYQKIRSLDNCARCTHFGISHNFNDETFIIKISKSKEENSQFAFDFDPLSNNLAKLSFSKDVGNFNYNLNSNMNLLSNISDYGVNLKISGTF